MSQRIKPKFWRDAGFYFSVLLLISVVLVIVLSLPFPYRAKLFPLIVGSIALPLIVIDILGKISTRISNKIGALRSAELFDTTAVEKYQSAQTTQAEGTQISYPALLKIALWFIGYFVLYYFLGYLPATIIFLFCFLKFYAHYSFKISAVITGVAAIALWAIFTVFLNLPPIKWFFS